MLRFRKNKLPCQDDPQQAKESDFDEILFYSWG